MWKGTIQGPLVSLRALAHQSPSKSPGILHLFILIHLVEEHMSHSMHVKVRGYIGDRASSFPLFWGPPYVCHATHSGTTDPSFKSRSRGLVPASEGCDYRHKASLRALGGPSSEEPNPGRSDAMASPLSHLPSPPLALRAHTSAVELLKAAPIP